MNDAISIKRISSPIGELVLGVGQGGCRLIEFADRSDARRTLAGQPCKLRVSDAEHALFRCVESALAAYFAGLDGAASAPGASAVRLHSTRPDSIPLSSNAADSLSLDLRGTPFQVAVWKALLDIPYGETRTYAKIADAVGKPAAVRAVGSAIGRNPISVLVPCHRVVRTGGGLGGYGGGLWRKEYLLKLEGRQASMAAA